MSHRLDPKLIEHARVLFARGEYLHVIGKMLGVSRSTVMRWKAADAAVGLGWEDLRRDTRRTFPTVIIATLERRLLVIADDDTVPVTAKAYALREIHRVIEAERVYAERVLAESGKEGG